jgi:hypothetical protein
MNEFVVRTYGRHKKATKPTDETEIGGAELA